MKLREVQFVLYARVNTKKSARRDNFYGWLSFYLIFLSKRLPKVKAMKLSHQNNLLCYHFTWNKCLSSGLIKCALFRLCYKTQTFVAKPFKTKESVTEKKTKGAKILIWTEHSIAIFKSQMLFLLWWFHRYNPEIQLCPHQDYYFVLFSSK